MSALTLTSPRVDFFGAYTTRGEGITQATYRYPRVVQTIHTLAKTRPSDDTYLSAQVNCSSSLAINQDKNNHSTTWITAIGGFQGGRLWSESAHGPPECSQGAGEKIKREFVPDLKDTWIHFDLRLFHTTELVTSGSRISIALFSPQLGPEFW